MTWLGKVPPRAPPDWRCRCGAKNAGKDAGCEGCGATNPKRRWARSEARPALSIAPPPTYAEPTPEDRVQAKAALAMIRAALAKKKSE